MLPALLVRTAARRTLAVPAVRYAPRAFATQAPPKGDASGAGPTPESDATSESPLTSGKVPSLDFAPGEEPHRERTGARSSEGSLSSSEKRRRMWGRVSVGLLLLGAGVQTWFMGDEWTGEELRELKKKREELPGDRWGRTKYRIGNIFNFFTEPIWPELLPPPLPAPHQKPYTLLISIDDLLVSSTWDRQHGWRTAKRPGVDYFLGYLSQFYEIVVFTTQQHYTAMPVLEKLDPYQFWITYKLFRDATRSVNGTPVKDLTYLNRDLSKVIIIDTHPEHVSAQPENAIVLPKWEGKPGDKGLVAMIPFLESIAIYKPADVRPILKAYEGKNIPLEYAKKEAEAKQKHIEDWEKNKKGLSTGGFTLSGLFGGPSAPANSSPVPPTYLEQKRAEAQALYREEQAYIAANKENFERLIREEQEAMAKAMPSTFWGAAGAMLGGPQPAQPQPGQSDPNTQAATGDQAKPAGSA